MNSRKEVKDGKGGLELPIKNITTDDPNGPPRSITMLDNPLLGDSIEEATERLFKKPGYFKCFSKFFCSFFFTPDPWDDLEVERDSTAESQSHNMWSNK